MSRRLIRAVQLVALLGVAGVSAGCTVYPAGTVTYRSGGYYGGGYGGGYYGRPYRPYYGGGYGYGRPYGYGYGRPYGGYYGRPYW